RLAALASLAAACPGQRSRTATALRPQPAQICPGHSRQCLLPHAYQRPGGCEQPHQGDQAHGLWLPGLSLLLPENQGRLPRESAMNHKKGGGTTVSPAKTGAISIRAYQVNTAPTAKVSVSSFCASPSWPSISNWLYSATSLRLSLMSWNSAMPRVS